MKTTRAQANDNNPFFSEAPRQLLGAVIASLNATQPGWTLADVVRILERREFTTQVLARNHHDADEGEDDDEAPRM